MTKIFTKEIRAAINSLVFFDAANVAHGETQAEYLAKNIRDMRKGAQAVVGSYKGMKGPKRDQHLRDNEVPQIAGRANTNVRLAWEYLASAAGARMVQRAEKGQLGKVATILGAKKADEKIVRDKKGGDTKKTRAPRQPNAADKKQVSFTATGKKPVTIADKLAALEAFAEAQGFSFVEFVAEWTAEADADTIKKVANG
jgi:hypothetical protein